MLSISTKTKSILFPILTFSILLLLSFGIIKKSDHDLRQAFLMEIKTISGAINIELISKLTGTKADQESPSYLKLKKQFHSICSLNEKCRFLYLMGINADGAIYFLLDNEEIGSKDESLPGDVYTDAPNAVNRAFANNNPYVVGPFTDAWGTFVSAGFPLLDPQTKNIIAIFALDYEARDWYLQVAYQSIIPLSLLIIIFIGLYTLFSTKLGSNENREDSNIIRRLLPTVTLIITLIFAVAGGIIWHQHIDQMNDEFLSNKDDVHGDFQQLLKTQADGLSGILATIILDNKLQSPLQKKNRIQLFSDWSPLFEKMHPLLNVTHFYFFDPQLINILRVHKKEKFGDRVDRTTLKTAQSSQHLTWGVELGTFGTLALRVVSPVFSKEEIIGYVEIGKEIEDIVKNLEQNNPSLRFVITILKSNLKREEWESGMKMLGRYSDWDLMPESAVIYHTFDQLPKSFHRFINSSPKINISFDNKVWRLSSQDIIDAAGTKVGDFIILKDVTTAEKAFKKIILIGIVMGVIFLILIIAILYVVLYRLEKIISRKNQFQKLISTISSNFVTTTAESLDADINNMLRKLGEHLEIDRSYLFSFSHDLNFMTNTHEWCAAQIVPQIGNIQSCPTSDLPWWKEKILSSKFVIINSVENLPNEAKKEKEEFSRQNIQSLITIPVKSTNIFWGILGFDAVKKPYRFSDSEINSLETLANIIADLLLKLHQKREHEKMEAITFNSVKLASIGTLSAGVAHEINNPLAIASGHVDLLQKNLAKSGSISQDMILNFDRIHNAFNRIVKIVNGLRNFARPDTTIVKDLDIHHEIDETLNFCEPIYNKIGIVINKDYRATFHTVKGSEGKLPQVMINLITNARDAIEGFRSDGVIQIETYNEKSNIIIQFSDNGRGIKKENLKKIFDPLFTTKEPGKGTGLGLSISYSIINALDGKIEVESEEGVGTKFVIILPCKQD